MTDQVRQITQCRACQSGNLEEVLDLGVHWISAFYKSREEGEAHGHRAPLLLMVCKDCWLVQLAHTAPPDWLYRNFWYKSGITQTMRDVLKGIADKATDIAQLQSGDYVCDIGANDGTLLRFYDKSFARLGFEPALNLSEEARGGGNVIFPDYFHAIDGMENSVKVITAVAMFYDLDDPMNFLHDVRTMLHHDGVFVIQMNYLLTMLQDTAFDNIGHEHLCYYSLTSLIPMLHRAGLHVEKVSLNDVNGGSIQFWCRKGMGREPNDDIATLMALEGEMGLDTLEPYAKFAERVEVTGNQIRIRLAQYPPEKIYICGASTRGSTILQTYGINFARVAGAGERDPRKIGMVMAGTWIPVVAEEEARKKADIQLVLPYHFKKEIVERESAYLERGGKLLFPLPVPTVVSEAMIGARL
jgi:NDP-4-keto-2,6-dideoxyhexose 3-C-methyltransferase